jgi:hypothetical protein
MEAFHQSIADLQREEGVRTIRRAHMLGFLDPNLPKRGQRAPDGVAAFVSNAEMK